MKIVSKQILPRKQPTKQFNTPTPKGKGLSKSLSKPIRHSDNIFSSPSKKNKVSELKVIKEVNKRKKDNNKDKDTHKEKQNNKDKDKKKKVNYCLNLKELKPVNMVKEKDIFFQKEFKYDPFFIYPNISDLNDDEYKDVKRFDTADDTYLSLAMQILDKSLEIQIWKLIQNFRTLSQEQVSEHFNSYIKSHEFETLLTYQFVQNTIAPTSVVHNNQDGLSKVLVGLPIRYKQYTIEGVLNHEIGTHFVRKFNEKSQKWFKDRKKYNLGAYLKTQEGLASLNQHISYVMNGAIPPLLYRAALLYYGCYLASKTSFSKIFQILAKYQPDPQSRWREVLRVKRGIADTSKPCGMYKDQIYFIGAVEILKNRKKLNMINLHSGKITVEDCIRLTQKKLICTQKIKLPHFLKNMKNYLQCLDCVAEANMIKD